MRTLRRKLRDPLWSLALAAIVIGAAAGTLMADLHTDEDSAPVLGRAWRGTARDARAVLLKVLGLQLTVLTLVVSASPPMIQSAANQYSPRLVPFYLKHAPVRHVVPVFLLAFAYDLAALRALGLQDERAQPQLVVSGAVILIVAIISVLLLVFANTFRLLRVEWILALVRNRTIAAIDRLARATADRSPAPGPAPTPAAGATVLRAASTGYLLQLDTRKLMRLARAARVRVRLDRRVGDYLDRGEAIGWVSSDEHGAPEDRLLGALADTLETSASRQLAADPLYGILVLADVAARTLPPQINDARTARQALQHLRSVLAHLATKRLGDWCIVDGDGATRIWGAGATLGECVSLAVEATLRSGAADPEVLDGVLEIALALGRASSAEARAIGRHLITAVVEDARHYGGLAERRSRKLVAVARLLDTSLAREDHLDRPFLRQDWLLPAE